MAATRKTGAASKGTAKAKAKAPAKRSKQGSANRKTEAAKRKARREQLAEEKRLAGEMDLAKQGLTGAARTIENARLYVELYTDWAFGMSYMMLAEKHKLGVRRCEQIVQAMRGTGLADIQMDDPLFGLREAQDLLILRKTAISEYAKLARETQNENIRLGAMRDRDRAAGEYLSMLQELGIVPKHLGILSQQTDFLALVDALLDGMEEEGIPVDVQRRMVERVELRSVVSQGRVQVQLGAGEVVDAEAA